MSNVSQNTFRPADPNDEDALLAVLQKAFCLEPDTKLWRKKRRIVEEHLSEFRVAEQNGQVVGGVHIRRDWLCVGKARLLKGDVGEVTVLPELQGQGLGSKILHNTVAWMKQERFDLSRLGGLVKFYSRFGYHRFPRRYVEISLGLDIPAGASVVHEGEIPLSEAVQNAIVPYVPAKHAEEYVRLTQCNENFLGWLAEEEVIPPADSPPLLLMYEYQGRAVAYVFAAEHDREHTEFEGKIRASCVAYEPERIDACVALLCYLNNIAYQKQIHRMTARLPFAPDLVEALSRSPLHFQVIETYGGKAGNMLQITNLASLLERMIPEFQVRLSQSLSNKFSGVLEVAIEKDSAQLRFDHGKIQLTANETPTVPLAVKELYLMQMTLGLLSYTEVEDILPTPSDDPAARGLLATLWPRKVAWSGCWG